MVELQGRRALVTGAASGIGRALAIKLAQAGCNLFLLDVDEDGLKQVAAELAGSGVTVQTFHCDLSLESEIIRCVQHALAGGQSIDLLVNNAGVAYYGPTDSMTHEQWNRLMQINLLAPIRLTGELLPHLLARPDAHIVNMCSISGLVAGGRFSAYHTSKFGLIGFTESIRAEYGRRGLGVTAICPGPVTTSLYTAAVSGRSDRKVPAPPDWICTTPEHVARVTLRAVRRNKRQVLITPMAHALYQLKRFAPGLIDFMNQFSRSKKKRRAEREALLQTQQACLQIRGNSETPSVRSDRRAA